MMTGQKVTTFLLIEDEPNDVFFVRHQFNHGPRNLRLFAVDDGADAIRYLEGQGQYDERDTYPLPDVILLDLKMPRINGFEFLEWLRGKAPDKLRLIPVIVMSSSSIVEDIHRAYALGANSYMIKPVDWDEFKDRLRALSIYWVEHVEKP